MTVNRDFKVNWFLTVNWHLTILFALFLVAHIYSPFRCAPVSVETTNTALDHPSLITNLSPFYLKLWTNLNHFILETFLLLIPRLSVLMMPVIMAWCQSRNDRTIFLRSLDRCTISAAHLEVLAIRFALKRQYTISITLVL